MSRSTVSVNNQCRRRNSGLLMSAGKVDPERLRPLTTPALTYSSAAITSASVGNRERIVK